MRRITIEELLASDEEVERFAQTLRRGGVAAVPTETFYALAADPASPEGVNRVRKLKGRGPAKPLLVLFGSPEQLEPLGVTAPREALDRYLAIWPAPLTVVLALREPIPASSGARSLGVRIPAHDALRSLLARTAPVTGTSLNRSGEPPCEDADRAAELFGESLDAIVDGGPTRGGMPSTLLDATVDPPRVLRRGAYPWPPPAR